ncbi:MAG: helix-turn-helix domain-containing protein [Myxococcota bacterium]
MELKERLKLLRETLGISTRAMSARLGLDASLWSQYESGRREPGALAIRALLKLGVNPHWLLEGHGSMFAEVQRRRKSKPNLPKLLKLIEETVMALTEDWLEIWEFVLQALERSPNGLAQEELLALPDLPSLDKVTHETASSEGTTLQT